MTTLNLSGSIARPRTTAKKGYYQEKQDPFPERWEGEAGCLEIAFNSTAESLDPLSCLLLLVAVACRTVIPGQQSGWTSWCSCHLSCLLLKPNQDTACTPVCMLVTGLCAINTKSKASLDPQLWKLAASVTE